MSVNSAAQRRQNVAPGASPGKRFLTALSHVVATESQEICRTYGAYSSPGFLTPGFRPGLHSVAAPRLAEVAP
jgi:hypothetical protein